MKLQGWLLAGLSALLMVVFALEPAVALSGAREGLNLFLSVVLPSLLPFMVCANLFIESGAAEASGRALSRLMRPVFACPGEAAFALTAGVLAGYPTGARIALDLKEKEIISAEDAQRTGILASSCGPVFMLGAVGAGLLGSPLAGWLIALSQWAGVLVSGLLFSAGGNRHVEKTAQASVASESAPAMAAFGASIKKAVDTLWAVGGYIILFSVVASLLRHYHALDPLAALAAPLFRLVGLEPSLAQPLAVGLVEMTNGCSLAASAPASLLNRCAVISVLVSFGGFCIQAQSMLFLSGAGLSAWKFALSKAVQAAAAFVACRLLSLLPAFSSSLCLAPAGAPGLTAASALLSSAVYTAGGMLVFTALALFSGRASIRGSA